MGIAPGTLARDACVARQRCEPTAIAEETSLIRAPFALKEQRAAFLVNVGLWQMEVAEFKVARPHMRNKSLYSCTTSAQRLQRRRILDRRQVARIAAFGERLDRAAQQLARARLRQQRHEMHARRPRDRAELRDRPSPSLRLAQRRRAARRRRRAPASFDHRERERHLSLQRIGDADDGDFGDAGCACTASSISRVPSRWPATLITSSVRPRMK